MTTTAITYEAGTLYHVAPGELLLERNIRDSKPTPEMVGSVAKLGVLEPITAVLCIDGRLLVRFGHRRVLAAIEVNLDTVPVYVNGDDDEADAAEVDRIIRQRDENTHRNGLTAAEETGVVEQLAAFGFSADEIAAQARMKKDSVTAALAVAGSKLARKAADKYADLTLDQAAAVAEFDDDTEISKELVVCALEDPHRFAHLLQRRRDDRERAKVKAATIAKLEAAGVNVVEPPGYDSKTKATRLENLVHAETGKNITPAAHKKCPGHVAWITHWGETGYGCTDPGKNGHRDRYNSSSTSSADMSEKEREQAKAQRKLVIENNKAWVSAETVRREWLATFAKAKAAPKGAAAFITDALVLDSGLLINDYRADPDKLAVEWLGLKPENPRAALCEAAAKASEPRALVIALVNVLANYELKATTKDAWRQNGTSNGTGRYLRFLEACGYGLSDVEKYAASSKTIR